MSPTTISGSVLAELSSERIRDKRTLAVCLGFGFLVTIAVYQYYYRTYLPVPGNDPAYPLGWWGWFDQGRYLRGAQALSRGDFRPSEHFYPPLYPLVGAIGLPLSANHPYYVTNLMLTLAYFTVFVVTFSRYIGPALATICAVIGMTLYWELRIQWVIPWTTTLGSVLTISAISLLGRHGRQRLSEGWGWQASVGNGVLFGLVVGLQLLTRPVDFLVLLPVVVTYAVMLLMDAIKGGHPQGGVAVSTLVAGTLAFSLPAAAFLLFNLITFGSVSGGYVGAILSNGISPGTILPRLFSWFISSDALYGERGADWLSVVPFILVAVLLLPAATLAGPLVLRCAALVGVLQFAIYGSYADLLPTGMFRYFNVHYYKWLAPVSVAIACYWALSLFSRDRIRAKGARFVLAVGLATIAITACVSVSYVLRPATSIKASEDSITLQLDGKEVDFVDVVGDKPSWTSIYFDKPYGVTVDGSRQLHWIAEYRTLPIADGVRILFMPPLHATTIEIRPADGVMLPVPLSSSDVRPVDVQFGFAVPTSRTWRPGPLPDYTLGDTIDFSTQGNAGRYLRGAGWSGPEAWGRWIDGRYASLQLNLAQTDLDLELSFEVIGFISSQVPEAEAKVYANGTFVGRLRVSEPGVIEKKLTVKRSQIRPGGVLRLEIRNQSPASPEELGLGGDSRKLAIGVKALSIRPIQRWQR